MQKSIIEQLRNFFAQQANIELALLIDSRALGQAREGSDWDFAIQWRRDISCGDVLEYTETLRAVIAEAGLLLKGENTLPWSHFLLKTGRDLEDFYWAKDHAA